MYMILNGKGGLTTIQVGGQFYWMDMDVLHLSVTVSGNKYLVYLLIRALFLQKISLARSLAVVNCRLIRAREAPTHFVKFLSDRGANFFQACKSCRSIK